MIEALQLSDCPPERLAPLRDLTRRPSAAEHVVVEGAESVRWLLQSPLRVELLLLKPSMLSALGAELAASDPPPLVVTASPAELSALLGFAFSRGVIACARRPQLPTLEQVAQAAQRLLLLDGVHDPGNVGGLVRSARCLGYDGLLLGPGCADPFYRRAVRVSVGHVLHLPLAPCADAASAVRRLRELGFRCYAGHRGPLSIPLSRLTAPVGRCCLVLGNEDRGPRPETVAACDAAVCIEMAPGVDSLGVAAAGAILLQALRHNGSDAQKPISQTR